MTDLHEEQAIVDKEFEIWTQEDNVLVEKITVVTHDDRTFIVVAKQNVLTIFGINGEGLIFDQKVEYVEDYYIIGNYFL